ncbi:hypothetical protein [Paracoccus nototheniae]|uniref:Meckel syndrome type 1 protein n=1 Tax=Paracoccus nototheniae TaxID=2489002 RepID=A0ABW4DYV9_9RHOB|nr:hypothetical protein [Paracoccus nototheniae]
MSFTQEAVKLECRDGPEWQPLGQARFAGGDLASQLNALRKEAGGRAGELDTVLVIPDDQILYTVLTVPFGSDTAATIARALEAASPYRADELAFDWCPAANGDIETLRVAAVARRTLDEAEEFARAQGFRPSGFQARPGDERFDGQPDFGPTRLAQEQFDRRPFSAPDLLQARITAPVIEGDGATPAPGAGVMAPVSRIVPHVVIAEPVMGGTKAAMQGSDANAVIADETPDSTAGSDPASTDAATAASAAAVIRHGQAGPLTAQRLSPRAEAVHHRAAAARAERDAAPGVDEDPARGVIARLRGLDPGRLPVMVGGLALLLVVALLFLGQPSDEVPVADAPATDAPVAATDPVQVTETPAETALPQTTPPAAAPIDLPDTAAAPDPAMPETAPADSLTTDSLTTDGLTTDSLIADGAPGAVAPVDGLAGDGSTTNGLPADGLAADGLAAEGVTTDAAPDGSIAAEGAAVPSTGGVTGVAPPARPATAADGVTPPAGQPDALDRALAEALAPTGAAAAPQGAEGAATAASGLLTGTAPAATPPAQASTTQNAAAPAARVDGSTRPPRATPAAAATPAAPDSRPNVPDSPLPYAVQNQPAATPVGATRPQSRPAAAAPASAAPATAQAPATGTPPANAAQTSAAPAGDPAASAPQAAAPATSAASAQRPPAPSRPVPGSTAPTNTAPSSTAPAAAAAPAAAPAEAPARAETTPAPDAARPPSRPESLSSLEEGSAAEPDQPRRLTAVERALVTRQLRDLRTAQAGNAPLSQAERGLVFQLADARPTRRPMAVGAPSQRAAQQATAGTAPSSPRPAARASIANEVISAPPAAAPAASAPAPVASASGAIQRSARPAVRPGSAPAARAVSGAAVEQAIASAISASPATPGAVPLTALTSSQVPPRRRAGNAAQAAAAPVSAASNAMLATAAPMAAALAPSAPDPRAAADAQAAAMAAQRRQDDELQAQAEARARSQAAADARADAQARAAAEARARAQAEAEARTAAARNQRYQPPEVDAEPEVVAAVPRNAIGNAAASATVAGGIQLNSTQIIGTIGAGQASRALVRLSNGRVLTLRIGDKINGGTITAIGDSRITYQKQGRAHALGVLNGQ